MEVALNVPTVDWYKNTSDNDLMYWGLDYPPLSAYVAYVFGKFVTYIEPQAVQLHSSRGFENNLLRASMRFTVILGDVLIFFPALLLLSMYLYNDLLLTSQQKDDTFMRVFGFCATLPAMLLIDHAHFQYNNISLGLFLLSVLCFLKQKEALGAALFCCSVYFKHMTLYYATAIFAYLSSLQIRKMKEQGLISFLFAAKVIFSIASTTLLIFGPWLSKASLFLGVVERLFPISRGLYEDKVASVWCSISVVVKLHHIMPPSVLFKFCALFTLFASLPFCIAVALKPSAIRLLLATTGCSLSAFLFSYQVHEKQILIPLIPLAMLHGVYPGLSSWMSFTAVFSLFPLLWREGSSMAYAAVLLIHSAAICFSVQSHRMHARFTTVCLIMFCLAVGLILNVTVTFGTPLSWAPDLFVMLNTMYSCGHLCLIYFTVVYFVFTS